MKAIKRVMRSIGIVTLRDHEKEMDDFRSKCEEFAKDYLDASRGVTIGSEPGFINGGELQSGGAIIGSRVSLDGLRFKHLVVAPWVNQVVISGCMPTGEAAHKNTRAVARVMRSDEAPFNCYVGTAK